MLGATLNDSATKYEKQALSDARTTDRFAHVRQAALLALERGDRPKALRLTRKVTDTDPEPEVKFMALSLIGTRTP